MRVMTFLVGVLKSASSIKMRIAGKKVGVFEKRKSSFRSLLPFIFFEYILIAQSFFPDRGTSKLKSLCSMEYRHRLPKKISNI
jgi:hypothetical protein